MKLLTNEIRRRLPGLYECTTDDPVVYAKLFCSWSDRTWYVAAFNGRDLVYGLTVTDGLPPIWDYFSLSELETQYDSRGRRLVRRDPDFKPTQVSRLEFIECSASS